MNKRRLLSLYVAFAFVVMLACTPQSLASPIPAASQPPPTATTIPAEVPGEMGGNLVSADENIIPITGHSMQPADAIPAPGKVTYDVKSTGKAASYGDSYKINRFERPFLKDMTYVADLDIVSFDVSEDVDWYYISIGLNGKDPNNSIGINYGAEIDLDADGFGDYILWAHPPYTTQWDTSTVQVFTDANHDSAGLSSKQSDVGHRGNGYETLVFAGSDQKTADPDLAWVRMVGGQGATIQFAFKKSLTGTVFMVGVVADAGLKDISKFDYNDTFKEAEAGSSVRNNRYYPVGSLYAVDNTCWEAYGIQTPASEPKFCPGNGSATATKKSPGNALSTSPTNTAPVTLLVTYPVGTETDLIVTVPTDQDPTREPATNEPPTVEPPTKEPPTVEPPTVEPPTAVPPPPPTVKSCDPEPQCSNYDPDTCQCP